MYLPNQCYHVIEQVFTHWKIPKSARWVVVICLCHSCCYTWVSEVVQSLFLTSELTIGTTFSAAAFFIRISVRSLKLAI